MYSVSELHPYSLRSQLKNADFPMKHIGKELSDLDPYEGDVIEDVIGWMNALLNGEVIKAEGKDTCGVGLLMIGKPGHGKTTLAATIAQEIIRHAPQGLWGNKIASRPVYFGDFPKLLRIEKNGWEDDTDVTAALYGELDDQSIKLLIVDDLGKEYRTSSGWAESTLDAMLRSRFNKGLPTIVTTNVPIESWGDTYGEPMYSFAHEAFMHLNVNSLEGDRRK